MTKWVLHVENLNEVDTEPLMRHLGGEIADDARRYAPVGKTGNLRKSIRVTEASERHAIVTADPRNPDPDTKPEDKAYAGYVERGTSDTPEHPFLRPAAYKYRSP